MATTPEKASASAMKKDAQGNVQERATSKQISP